MSTRAGIGAVVAAVACLVCAGPASAARTELVRMQSHTPKLIAGGAVFLAPASGGETRVVRVVPGQATRTLATLAASPRDSELATVQSNLRLASSDTHVAASRFVRVVARGAEAENSFRIEAGPATGPLSTVHQCRGDQPIDVDTTRVAYTNACVEQGGTPPVLVRNLDAPNAQTIAVISPPAPVTELDLAGQHVAMLSAPGGNPQIAVRDYALANDAYVVPAANVDQFSLQADGTLAVTERTESTCRIAWYSKAEPVAHNIEACPFAGIDLVGGRIAFVRQGDSGASLEVVNLAGQSQTVAAFNVAFETTGFDFDGSRVAYGVGGCVSSRDAVYVDDLTGPVSAAESAACPVAISKAKVRASSKGLVKVAFTCKVGCQGLFRLTRGGKSIVTGTKLVNRGAGSGKVTVRLTSAARRLLADRESLAVKAELEAAHRDGETRTYTRTLRLLAPG